MLLCCAPAIAAKDFAGNRVPDGIAFLETTGSRHKRGLFARKPVINKSKDRAISDNCGAQALVKGFYAFAVCKKLRPSPLPCALLSIIC